MKDNQVNTVDSTQFIVVRFDREQYGISIRYIQNIVRKSKITRVPNAPVYFKGVINLRGEIIPVMSIRKKFGLADDIYSNSTRIIIVKVEGDPIGLIVDEVLEVVQLSEEQIEKVVLDSSDDLSKVVYAVGNG